MLHPCDTFLPGIALKGLPIASAFSTDCTGIRLFFLPEMIHFNISKGYSLEF